MVETLTRTDLSRAVCDATNVPAAAAAEIVDAVLDEMVQRIVEDNTLKLSGFGTFKKHKKKERIGRNPKTGTEAPIAPRTVLSFTPSNIVKTAVNEALSEKK